jgi:hypothetical protein
MILGRLSSAIYTTNNICLIGSFLTMQSFVEWENYQLKKSQNWTKQNPISVKKTGVISIFVILVAGLHLYVLFSVSEDSKTQTYHLCKVF